MSKKPQSLWDILVGNGSNGGYRYNTSGGASITSGPTKDPKFPGGHYTSVTKPNGGKKSNTYNADGSLGKSGQNKKW